jgi:hypothetical protein
MSNETCSHLQVQVKAQCAIPHLLFLWFLLFFSLEAAAQSIDIWNTGHCTFRKDEKYGEPEKNKFDIIMPQSSTPTALIIFIHGGGFVQGDKEDAYSSRSQDIANVLQRNIAFASLNYRFSSPDDSLGVAVYLKDIRTALQYIRHHADKYNVVKERVACYGSSAGAGSSLYLAFHDDFALKGDTTLLGESTRITCVGALATQATYDVFRWEAFIPGLDSLMAKLKDKFYEDAAHFYGYPTYKAFEPQRATISREFDMLQMISPDDPPVYIMNLQKETGSKGMGAIQHHRAHAFIFAEYLERNGIEHEVYVYGEQTTSEKDIPDPIREFLVRHLLER